MAVRFVRNILRLSEKLEKVREFQKILAVATMINGLAFHVYNQTPGILH